MFVVHTSTGFVGADQSRREDWRDAKRYPTLAGARLAARNAKGSVLSLSRARVRSTIYASMQLIRMGDFLGANLLLDTIV